MNDILDSIFADLDPKRAERENMPLAAVLGERLEKAASAIQGEATGDPLAVARMRTTLAKSLRIRRFSLTPRRSCIKGGSARRRRRCARSPTERAFVREPGGGHRRNHPARGRRGGSLRFHHQNIRTDVADGSK
jgi:hypothetical protein